MRGQARLAPFIALAVAVVVAGLFVVLLGSDPPNNETAETNLMGLPAPEARGVLDDGSAFQLSRRKGDWVDPQLLPVELRAVPGGAPRARGVRRRPAGRSPTAPASTRSCGTTPARTSRSSSPARAATGRSCYDDAGSISVAFGVTAVPETWIIDPGGVIRYRTIATVTADSLGATLQQLRERFG